MLTKEEILVNLKSKKGSYSQSLESDTSDIDILVEFEPNTQDLFDLKMNLKNELTELFGKTVDVCREKYIKPYFKKQILESATYVK